MTIERSLSILKSKGLFYVLKLFRLPVKFFFCPSCRNKEYLSLVPEETFCLDEFLCVCRRCGCRSVIYPVDIKRVKEYMKNGEAR